MAALFTPHGLSCCIMLAVFLYLFGSASPPGLRICWLRSARISAGQTISGSSTTSGPVCCFRFRLRHHHLPADHLPTASSADFHAQLPTSPVRTFMFIIRLHLFPASDVICTVNSMYCQRTGSIWTGTELGGWCVAC